jgi:hypothetical protein
MTKTITLFLSLLLIGDAVAVAQNKRPLAGQLKMKTVRLHIDGFSKSKSGAV